MSVPDFQTLMLPVLRVFADGQARKSAEVRDLMAREFGIGEMELGELLPSGRQSRFNNRVAWALSYLGQARLLEKPSRGVYRLSDRGRGVLGKSPARIDIPYLMQFAEFQEFRARTREDTGESDEAAVGASGAEAKSRLTPDEQIREGDRALRTALATELLDRVQRASPAFFESLVVELLVAMGYGGTQEDAASVVGRSGDGGIDGIIKEDRLGLENIYIQAKRWKDTHTVGRPDVQQFAGALQGQRARKGVFITTSSFSRDAIEYAKGLQTTIVLVDGEQLAQLMLDHEVGVSVQDTIKLLKVDEDYFEEE